MEQILAAKRALATVDVITQAAALMHPSAQQTLTLATYKVLGVSSDDEALAALAKRGDAVIEFDPLTDRIDQLEKMVRSLATTLNGSGSQRERAYDELLERANKLIGKQS